MEFLQKNNQDVFKNVNSMTIDSVTLHYPLYDVSNVCNNVKKYIRVRDLKGLQQGNNYFIKFLNTIIKKEIYERSRFVL